MTAETELLKRIMDLEQKVAYMLDVLGLTDKFQSMPPAPDADILALAQAGQKIEAIKLYREKYNVGLAEAKTAVEAMVAQPKSR